MDDVIKVVDSKKPGDEVTLELLRGEAAAHGDGEAGQPPDSVSTSQAARAAPQQLAQHDSVDARRRAASSHRPGPRSPGRHRPAPAALRFERMTTKVKICGITDLDDAELAVGSGAWAIGHDLLSGEPAPLRARDGGRDRDRAEAAQARSSACS